MPKPISTKLAEQLQIIKYFISQQQDEVLRRASVDAIAFVSIDSLKAELEL